MTPRLILGSSSPRRQELLTTLLAATEFEVDPPREFTEPECRDPSSHADVRRFVEDLARAKAANVVARHPGECPVLGADTVVVASDGSRIEVLGKPPEGSAGGETVKRWLTGLLSDKPHSVMTGVALARSPEQLISIVVETTVTFVAISESMADWYIGTGEPEGKAGGYAVQGEGALLVRSLEGSFSNVVGLPLWETRELLESEGIPTQLCRP